MLANEDGHQGRGSECCDRVNEAKSSDTEDSSLAAVVVVVAWLALMLMMMMTGYCWYRLVLGGSFPNILHRLLSVWGVRLQMQFRHCYSFSRSYTLPSSPVVLLLVQRQQGKHFNGKYTHLQRVTREEKGTETSNRRGWSVNRRSAVCQLQKGRLSMASLVWLLSYYAMLCLCVEECTRSSPTALTSTLTRLLIHCW